VGKYTVALTSSATRELDKLPSQLVSRVFRRLENPATDPRPRGCKKMQGGDREWRIRIGDYRVVYTIDDAKLLVEGTRVRHRSAAYGR